MSYQAAEEITMLVDQAVGDTTTPREKKNSVFLATLLVLSVAVSSFMAGHAYASSATASSVSYLTDDRWE